MRTLRILWSESVKQWKIKVAYPAEFLRTLVEPVLYILPFVFYGLAVAGGPRSGTLAQTTGTSDVVTFTVIGYVFMGFLNVSLWGMGFSLRKEQYWGTLETIFVSPTPRWVYVMGQALHSVLHQGLILLIQAGLIGLTFGLSINGWGLLPAFGVLALMLLALFGLGIMVAAVILVVKEGWMVAEGLDTIVSMITPIAYPLAVMPAMLKPLSFLMPTTYGISAIRHFLIGEKLPWGLGLTLTGLIFLSALWIVLGILVFRRMDKKVRREGTLGEY